MGRKFARIPEQILGELRDVEVLVNHGATVAEAARKTGVSPHTYNRW